ncbi:MAG: hypothetical protein K9H26_18765 [Prolixibacteraceae bacterium]|nr:hypothetical protein [Prolixibacteraceae bacterium]
MKKVFISKLLIIVVTSCLAGYNNVGGTVYESWGENPKEGRNTVEVNSSLYQTFYLNYDIVSDAFFENCYAEFWASVATDGGHIFRFYYYEGGDPLCDIDTILINYYVYYTFVRWYAEVNEENKYCSLSVNLSW